MIINGEEQFSNDLEMKYHAFPWNILKTIGVESGDECKMRVSGMIEEEERHGFVS